MQINLLVPHHSTVSKRLGRLKIKLPKKKESASHALQTASSIQQGWKCTVRENGKLDNIEFLKEGHGENCSLCIDETTGQRTCPHVIISAVATTNNYHDSQVLGDILDGVEEQIS